MKANDLYALSIGVLAAFFSGVHGVIARHLTEHIHGTSVAAIRLYVAAVTLFVILRAYGKPIKIDWKDATLLITVGAFSANYVVFHWGLQYAGASVAMVLENTAPAFVVLISFVVLRDRVRFAEILAAFVAIFGVYFTVRGDFALGDNHILGDELELLAGLTWAVFLLASTRAVAGTASTFERLTFLFAVLSMSALVLTPLLLIFPPQLGLSDAVLLLLLGVFPTAVAYYLWYETAARVSAVTTSLLFTLSVVFTFINASFFLDEPISFDVLVGAALIIASVLVSKLQAQ